LPSGKKEGRGGKKGTTRHHYSLVRVGEKIFGVTAFLFLTAAKNKRKEEKKGGRERDVCPGLERKDIYRVHRVDERVSRGKRRKEGEERRSLKLPGPPPATWPDSRGKKKKGENPFVGIEKPS